MNPSKSAKQKTSDAGLQLIKESEGLRTTAYPDSVGVWSIGYGHTNRVKRATSATRIRR